VNLVQALVGATLAVMALGRSRWLRWPATVQAPLIMPARRFVRWLSDRCAASRRRTILGVATLAAALGAIAGGPVAGFALSAYGGLATHAALRSRAARTARGERRRQLDRLGALASDLRAGSPPPTSGDGRRSPTSAHPPRWTGPPARGERWPADLVTAAVRIAEATGAPLADLLDRIEADARSMDRGLASAAAQAAGARATGWLLAGLPAGGIALGYGIGVDPLAILLHTPAGAACALGAVGLQIAGLTWADRLGATGTGAP
jgi:tight adherence protein B